MNLPIGRFLGKGGLEHWKRVRKQCEDKFGAENIDTMFPEMAYQLTHNALFPHDCVHIENLGGTSDHPELRWQLFAELLSNPYLPSQLR